MPIPALVGLGAYIFPTAVATVLRTVGLSYVIALVTEKVNDFMNSDGVSGFITEKVNEKLSAHGLDLHFRNVFDKAKVLDDVDGFAARRVNGKAGTNFSTLKGVDREAFLVEVSKVLATRVNTETGSNITALWPVETLRRELGTELARQFEPGVDLAAGAIFPKAKLIAIEAAIGKKLGVLYASPVVAAGGSGSYWPAARDAAHELERAKGRIRAEKYRRTHRQVWVESGR